MYDYIQHTDYILLGHIQYNTTNNSPFLQAFVNAAHRPVTKNYQVVDMLLTL